MIISFIYFYKKDFEQILVFSQKSASKLCYEHIPQYCVEQNNITFLPSDTVVTGTSGINSSFEMSIIEIAKQEKVKKTIAIVDNVTNFEMRFILNNKIASTHIPDEIWVFNKEFISKNSILNSRLKYKNNIYIQYLKKFYKQNKPKVTHPLVDKFQQNYLLILTEYLYELYGLKFGFTEYDMLENILDQISSLKLSIPIFLKLHPRENRNKFNILLRKYSHLNIFLIECNIQELVFYGKLILGINSSVFIECNIFNKPHFSVLIDSNKSLTPTFIETQNIIYTNKRLQEVLSKYFPLAY